MQLTLGRGQWGGETEDSFDDENARMSLDPSLYFLQKETELRSLAINRDNMNGSDVPTNKY